MAKLLLFCLLCIQMFVFAEQDLEEYVQDFVVETKKIEISDYPHAFNPSFLRWQGRLLMSFRAMSLASGSSGLSSMGDSKLGLVWLDDEFNPIGKPQILNLKNVRGEDMQSEDARLISADNRLYLIYSGNGNTIIEDEFFRMYAAELFFDGISFSITSNECFAIFEGRNKNKREKNWVPFSYKDELFLAYSLKPHKILKPLLDGSKMCQSFCSTNPSIVWEWGELRGGTPALQIDGENYLSFFHSSKLMATTHSNFDEMPHYFMGAYLFSSEPPFAIKQISPEPICGHGFYKGQNYQPYWHPVQVVFPCGLLVEEPYIFVAYGRQDHELWVVKLEKQALLESLIQVSTLNK